MSKIKNFFNKENIFSFTKQLKIFLSTILIISSLLMFTLVINNKKKLEESIPIESKGISDISLKLENEFNNYNDKLEKINYLKNKNNLEEKSDIDEIIFLI